MQYEKGCISDKSNHVRDNCKSPIRQDMTRAVRCVIFPIYPEPLSCTLLDNFTITPYRPDLTRARSAGLMPPA